MTQDEYRQLWASILGRWPDFQPTPEQTSDWHNSLHVLNYRCMQAAVRAVVTQYASQIPRLPWFLEAHRVVCDGLRTQASEEAEEVRILREEAEEAERIRDLQISHQRGIDALRAMPQEKILGARDYLRRRGLFLQTESDEPGDWSPFGVSAVLCWIHEERESDE